jgi:bifunctional NMN adenylyltransferase/nudix hydrolase
MSKKLATFIGRFQPFHSAHKEVVIRALDNYDGLLFVIGGDLAPRTIKNPFTVNERIAMIKESLPDHLDKLHFTSIRDYLYNDNVWATQVVNRVKKMAGNCKVILVGSEKDASSYYLKMFPQWDQDFIKPVKDVDATKIRNSYFNTMVGTDDLLNISEGVRKRLADFKKTSEYQELLGEYKYIQRYKDSWKVSPYPVTFSTVDSVVFKSAHVLVVVRKVPPGQGLYALPGGFLDQSETLIQGAIRELYEETKILYPRTQIEDKLIGLKTFDHPERSLRGRTITTAFNFDLGVGDLPDVKGADDAKEAVWMPFDEVSRNLDMFFEDHAHIIEYFMYKNGK